MLNPRIFRGNQGRELRSALFFASPWFVGMALLAIGPIGLSAFYSFTDYHVMAPPNWIGLENYQQLFGDPLFWTSLGNTAYYTLLSVPLGVIASLCLALLVNRSFPGRGLVRAAFYAPTLVAGVALAMLWGQLFAGDYGLVNQALGLVHLSGPPWLASPDWAKPTFVLMSIWGAGSGMVLYLAALQSVPTHLYEAALVDGAGTLSRFWHVTLPMLSSTILFHVILLLIASSQIFTQAYALTNGGPDDSTLFYVLYIYRQAFENLQMGYASAAGWILLLLTFAVTALVLLGGSRLVYYEFEGGR
jgi:multiple sugar transport system permease protein